MREYLSPERDANAIRLQRSTFLGTFLLVEGKSDKIFYEHLVDKLKCQVKIFSDESSQKLRVIKVLDILDKSNFDGVIAIVDADFEHLGGLNYNTPNLFLTDTHDLETMIVKSPALEKVLITFGSEEKLLKLEKNIRTVLIESGSLIGYLRWVSQCDNLKLTFNGIRFKKFVDTKTMYINESAMIQEIKNKSQAFSLNDVDLQQRLTNKKNGNHDLWQVCCGHDLVEILSIGLRNAIGSNKEVDVEARSSERKNTLENFLLNAYEAVYFRETQLCYNILLWENNNHPYKVLRDDI